MLRGRMLLVNCLIARAYMLIVSDACDLDRATPCSAYENLCGIRELPNQKMHPR